jgi:long-chain acyl-CoA synthetase
MTTHARPWLGLYPQGDTFSPRFEDGLSLFRHAVAQAPDAAALHYFDRTISYRELDRLSDAFAAALADEGIAPGDRVALYLQNVPQFVLCLVGAWKAGAVGVSINPMSRARELRLLLQDSGARVLVAQRELHAQVVREVLPDFPQLVAIATSPREFQGRDDPRVFEAPELAPPDDAADLATLLRARSGRAAGRPAADPAAAAMIVYTSGTTGVPKGAVVSHRNLAVDAELWRAYCRLRDGGAISAIAPMFHITGLVGHMAAAFACAAPMILSMRFHPDVVAEAAAEHGAEFMTGAITAFIALMNSPGVQPSQLRSVRRVYSGGAPVPAAVAAAFEQKFGLPVHNGYGLTESSSIAVGVPADARAPIDENGALSIGVPVFATDCYIAGDRGEPLPAGQPGEIMLRGPQVVGGYWQRPAETQEAFFDGFLRTGDIGYMNAAGWLFIVDRKKDMIIASGYKVWPKEVEDVLYTHPAVLEAAVVGVPDSYRGETVKAVVSLKAGSSLDAATLEAFCRERMAAYKVPRMVEFLPELPKTLTGKILRRALR